MFALPILKIKECAAVPPGQFLSCALGPAWADSVVDPADDGAAAFICALCLRRSGAQSAQRGTGDGLRRGLIVVVLRAGAVKAGVEVCPHLADPVQERAHRQQNGPSGYVPAVQGQCHPRRGAEPDAYLASRCLWVSLPEDILALSQQVA